MEKILHIVEPTLEGMAGHCPSFVETLCRAGSGRGFSIRVWAGKGATLSGCGPDVEVRNHFIRRLRRFQALFLYRRLLGAPGRILISTAGRADLFLLSWAARETIPPGKAFLYFHWVRPKPGKLEFFRRAAARHPDLVIMGPTPTVIEDFRRAGFRDTRVVPYPITPVDDAGLSEAAGDRFRHLLFAGGARQDKGFSHVVDLIAHIASRGMEIPAVVQASSDHYARYDVATRRDLARLAGRRHPWVRILPETLDSREYRRLFPGAICLQPYDRNDFADRVSGVTLDAFSEGAPVVTVSGTWIGRAVERFGAGVVVDDPSPPLMLEAVEAVRREYRRFAENAREAGRVLQEEHGARRLFEALSAPAEGRGPA